MATKIDRRLWLRQSTLALAGLGLAPDLFAAGKQKNFHLPGNLILLNSNENPYGPSPMARKAILDTYLLTNRYPDDYVALLKKKIASHWKVNEENILLGAGSSEIIGLACQHVSKIKGHIITGEPSYKVWNHQAKAFGLGFQPVALNDEKKLDLSKMFGSINGNTRMIYICNPNNPTGTVCDVAAITAYAKEALAKTFVFIDEAYSEFAELESMATLAARHKNIVVAKTFSKIYGLAGARIGYAIAHPETIQALSSYQPWSDANVSVTATSAALASLDDTEFVKECRENIAATREICYPAFKQLSLTYIPSLTNFIMFNIDKIKGDFIKQMQAENIYVQYRNHFGGNWCRVSMGTKEEMYSFVNALKKIAG